ncbi:NADH:flavin oxidoreductase/NADH oxidase family protein [Paenibacillus sp. R14(2021)]|uniref:NADH:flavin oxidoreductase/NADH oxidase family protein n=1 Tax=Paenibacillus sp. R14(2021) TaxID=2859228 RepID=UPI001C611FEA|nr:NADH:flavin oxidoreductase/NADH oxidase family protein [Paenibacillus sp. R14(2021)]
MSSILSQPLVLPSGALLANRLAKASLSEGLADTANNATPRMAALYSRWARSGAGLLLSGNVQVDRLHLERPSNIVLDERSDLAALAVVSKAGTAGGAHFWLQLSHTGRQVSDLFNPAPLAPSRVTLVPPRVLGLSFAPPKPMTEADIEHAIGQFANAARLTREAGFTGVHLHAAHGYLFTQFLSPLTNHRTDRWGGSLPNRARFLLRVIEAVREATGRDFPIGIKLNSSDFQKGGFTHAECIELVKILNGTGLDLLELSGGTLEQPKMIGVTLAEEEDARSDSTIKREAFFVEYAAEIRAVANMPVMVTGNFRTRAGMIQSLENGDLDVVGLGRPVIADPRSPAKLLAGELEAVPTPERAIDAPYDNPWFSMQLERLADGLDPDLSLSGEQAAADFKAIEQRNYAALLNRQV